MSKRLGKTTILIPLLLALTLVLLSGCAASASPAETITRFQDAYNRLDMDTALDCLEPVQAKAIKSMVNIFTGVAGLGFNADDLFGVMPLLANIPAYDENGNITGSAAPKIAFQIGSVNIDGNTASCSVSISYTVGGQTSASVDGVCTLVRENGKWYIYNLQ